MTELDFDDDNIIDELDSEADAEEARSDTEIEIMRQKLLAEIGPIMRSGNPGLIGRDLVTDIMSEHFPPSPDKN